MAGRVVGLTAFHRTLPLLRAPRVPWGLLDQGVISLSNFLSMAMLARALGPGDFGAFALVFSFLMLSSSVQATTICQPHNILAAQIDAHAYADLSVSSALLQAVYSIVTVALVSAVMPVLDTSDASPASRTGLVVSLFLAYQWQEFFRRILYSELRHLAAAINDVIAYTGQAFLVAALWLSGSLGSISTALWAATFTSALAAAIGACQTRASFGGGRATRAHLLSNWRLGRWLGAAAVTSWLSSQLLIVLTASILGTAAVGHIKATELALRPFAVVLNYLDTVLPIRFSRLLAHHPRQVFATDLIRVSRRTLSALAIYGLLFAVFGPPLLETTFGNNYADYRFLPALFALYFLLMACTRLVSSALKALHESLAIFRAGAVALAISAPAAWLLIRTSGVYGVMLGLVLAAATTLIMLLWMCHSALSRPAARRFRGTAPDEAYL